ncbi:MAG: hypothetical protein LC781_14455 [Actinobacteria bacterium]|nr:hypothetical protein [Actinomycetota bacterium]
MSDASANRSTVESRVPARMDRLPWSRWHWLVIAALGIVGPPHGGRLAELRDLARSRGVRWWL